MFFGDTDLLVATVFVDVFEDVVGILVEISEVRFTKVRLDFVVDRKCMLDILSNAVSPPLTVLQFGDVLL